MRFVDTNVLLYAISQAKDERERANRANEILADKNLVLSTQVLQEFYVQATRESREDRLSHQLASELVESFLRFDVQEITISVVRAAIALRDRFGISYWDAAIIATAKESGCDVVLSEDLSVDTDYDGIRVENPFA